MVGRVALVLIQEGGPVRVEDIVRALHLMSTRTDEDVIRTRCRKAIRMLADKMH